MSGYLDEIGSAGKFKIAEKVGAEQGLVADVVRAG